MQTWECVLVFLHQSRIVQFTRFYFLLRLGKSFHWFIIWKSWSSSGRSGLGQLTKVCQKCWERWVSRENCIRRCSVFRATFSQLVFELDALHYRSLDIFIFLNVFACVFVRNRCSTGGLQTRGEIMARISGGGSSLLMAGVTWQATFLRLMQIQEFYSITRAVGSHPLLRWAML